MISIATAYTTSLWSLLLQQLLRQSDLSSQHYYVTILSIVPASITSLWFPLPQHPSRHYEFIDTAATTSLCSLLLPHLSRHYDPYSYSTYYVAMTSTATASITALWSLLLQPTQRHYELWSPLLQHLLRQSDLSLQHLLHHYALYCSNNYYVTMILWLYWYSIYHVTMLSIVTTFITSIWFLLLQHL